VPAASHAGALPSRFAGCILGLGAAAGWKLAQVSFRLLGIRRNFRASEGCESNFEVQVVRVVCSRLESVGSNSSRRSAPKACIARCRVQGLARESIRSRANSVGATARRQSRVHAFERKCGLAMAACFFRRWVKRIPRPTGPLAFHGALGSCGRWLHAHYVWLK
jgi:hypothetical protein